MKFKCLFIFTFLFVLKIYAQKNYNNFIVKGVVFDSLTNNPIENVSLSFKMNLSNSNLILNCTTDNKGYYKIELSDNLQYEIILSKIGHDTKIEKIFLSHYDTTINFKLNKHPTILDTVYVKNNNIIYGIDKTTFIIGINDTKITPKLSDYLNTVPNVELTKDLILTLNGRTGINLMIDNKPVYGNQILNSLPTSAINKIEIINSTSPKYSQGLSNGIINIITKNDNSGLFLNMGLDIGTSLRKGSIYTSYRSNKQNIYFITGYNSYSRDFNSKIINSDLFNNINSIVNTFARNRSISPYFNLGYKFSFDSLRELSITNSLFFPNFENNGLVIPTQSNYANSEFVKRNYYMSNINMGSKTYLDYIINSKNKKNIFTLSLYFSTINNFLKNNNSFIDTILNIENKYKIYENIIQANNQYIISKNTDINLGIKFLTRSSNTSFFDVPNYKNTTTKSNNDIPIISNYQNIFTLYNTYKFPVLNKLVSIFNISLDFSKDKIYLENTTLHKNNIILFPEIIFQYKYNDHNIYKISYNKQIQRPSISYLTSLTNNIDPLNQIFGNPNLLPEIYNRIEFTFFKKIKSKTYNIILYSNINRNIIDKGIFSYGQDTITYSYFNSGKVNDFGFNVYIPIVNYDKFRINSSYSYEYNVIKTTRGDQHGDNYSFKLSSSYLFSNNISFVGNYNFRSTKIYSQGIIPEISSIDLSFRKIFFKKITISLNASDFLNNNSLRIYTYKFKVQESKIINNLNLKNISLSVNIDIGNNKYRAKSTASKINSSDLKMVQ